MALRIRRGTEAQRTAPPYFESGEIVWTTDYNQLWVGDGITQGGIPVVGSNITGHGLTYDNVTHKIGVAGLTTDDIAPGNSINRQYFSTEAAQDAAWALLRDGTHTGISFSYVDDQNKINATVALDGVGIMHVSDDTTPMLGGSLDLDGFNINGIGNIDITGDITLTGTLSNGTFSLLDEAITTSGTLTVKTNTRETLSVDGITGGTLGTYPGLFVRASRGTVQVPTTTLADDVVSSVKIEGWDGTAWKLAAGFVGKWASDAVLSDELPASELLIVTGAGGSDFNTLSFNGMGQLTVPTVMVGDGDATNPSIAFTTDGGQDTGFFHPGDGIVCISTNAQERVRVDSGGMRVNGFMKVAQVNGTLPSPAEAGMIVLDGTTFKGYNGSAWVALN